MSDRGAGAVLEEAGIGLAEGPPGLVEEILAEVPPGMPPPVEDDGGGGAPGRRPAPGLSNARLGLFVFLGAEAVFFGALILAFLVFRLGSAAWPPPGQPRLPVVVTLVNTAVLLASGLAMRRALDGLRRGEPARLRRGLGRAAGLGGLFLLIQGSEWARLLGFGLRLSSGTYGATFYVLIGTHGAHVLGALAWVLTVLAAARRPGFAEDRREGVAACGLYWCFVVALWPILFLLVYL
jgi:heme/copper-type cytochrome/quinol oxidase subunit 3